ncbi:MAG TPA: XRE family transcriptional regulator [Bacteroidales bacterium]|nr:XRE family transcriptional regulator [Bacteroidales bacterium]
MLLGEKISSLRKSKGISQELLAEDSNISLRTIQRIEKGTTTPRPHTIKTLANALGVPVEQLSSIEANTTALNRIELEKLKLINFSALACLLIPFSNILLTIILWRKHKAYLLVNEIGRKIISFQLLWTLGTLLLVFLTPFIQYSIVKSYVIGHFPPTIFLVYIALLVLNLVFTIRAAKRLQKGRSDIYSFVPILL